MKIKVEFTINVGDKEKEYVETANELGFSRETNRETIKAALREYGRTFMDKVNNHISDKATQEEYWSIRNSELDVQEH